MFTAYSISAFVVAFFAGNSAFLLLRRTPSTAKTFLRRVLIDAGIVALPLLGVAVFRESEPIRQILFGVVAEVVVSWALLLVVLGAVGIRWIFTDAD